MQHLYKGFIPFGTYIWTHTAQFCLHQDYSDNKIILTEKV